MKLCWAVPEVTSKLKSGSLSLTTAVKLQTYFEKQDKKAKAVQKNLNLKDSQQTLESTDKLQSELNKIAPAAGCVKIEIKEKIKIDEQEFNLSNSQEAFESTDKTQSELNKIAPAAGCVKTEIKEKIKIDEQEFNLSNSQEAFKSTDKTQSELNKIAPAAGCVKVVKVIEFSEMVKIVKVT